MEECMPVNEPVRWHCPNRDCNTWFVGKKSAAKETAPRCICGRTMRQEDGSAVFRYLDFLKQETTEAQAVAFEKE
jgi:hypothetical protein